MLAVHTHKKGKHTILLSALSNRVRTLGTWAKHNVKRNGWAERRDAEQAADKSKVAGRKRKPVEAPAQQKIQKREDMRERSAGTERELRKGAGTVENAYKQGRTNEKRKRTEETQTGEETQTERSEPIRRKCKIAKNGLALQLWIEAKMIPRTGAG